MSDAVTQVKQDPPPEPGWAKAIISIVVLLLYGTAHWIAWMTKTGLEAMLGADGSLAAAVVYYWVGSSASSDRKTNIISKQGPV